MFINSNKQINLKNCRFRKFAQAYVEHSIKIRESHYSRPQPGHLELQPMIIKAKLIPKEVIPKKMHSKDLCLRINELFYPLICIIFFYIFLMAVSD